MSKQTKYDKSKFVPFVVLLTREEKRALEQAARERGCFQAKIVRDGTMKEIRRA